MKMCNTLSINIFRSDNRQLLVSIVKTVFSLIQYVLGAVIFILLFCFFLFNVCVVFKSNEDIADHGITVYVITQILEFLLNIWTQCSVLSARHNNNNNNENGSKQINFQIFGTEGTYRNKYLNKLSDLATTLFFSLIIEHSAFSYNDLECRKMWSREIG